MLKDPLIPGADDDDLIGLQGSFDHFINLFFQIALMVADHFRFGLCDRMFGHKDGTAVLIGENGSLISPDFLGDCDDLLLVKADQGTEDAMISSLSKPIRGRKTGRVHTSLVTPRAVSVWEATWPMLSPVTRPRHSLRFASSSAIRII